MKKKEKKSTIFCNYNNPLIFSSGAVFILGLIKIVFSCKEEKKMIFEKRMII